METSPLPRLISEVALTSLPWTLKQQSSPEESLQGRGRRPVRAVRLRTAEPFVSAFSSVIYKSQLTLVTFQAAEGAGRAAPWPYVCVPLCLLRPAGMTRPSAAHVRLGVASRSPLLWFPLERFNLLLAAKSSRPPPVIFHDSRMEGAPSSAADLLDDCPRLNSTFLRLPPLQITSASEWKMLVRFLFQPSAGLLAIRTPAAFAIFSQRIAVRNCGGIKFPQVQCLL